MLDKMRYHKIYERGTMFKKSQCILFHIRYPVCTVSNNDIFSHRTNDSHKLDLLVSFCIVFFMTASFHLEAWCRPLKLGLSRHIHWSACTKPGKWAVMYLCVRGIDFVSFSTIFLLDFGAVPKVRYFIFLFV